MRNEKHVLRKEWNGMAERDRICAVISEAITINLELELECLLGKYNTILVRYDTRAHAQ
jgi:hypothetical protein